MIWNFLIIFNVVACALISIFNKTALKENKSEPVAYAILFQSIVGVIFVIVAFFYHPSLPAHVITYWPYLILMAIFYALANILWFKGLKKIEISTASIISASKSFWIMAGAVMLLHEAITTYKVLGAVLIFISLIIVMAEGQKFKLNHSALLILFSSIFYGAAFVIDGYLLKSFNVFLYSAIAFLLPVIVMILYSPHSFPAAIKIIKQNYFYKVVFAALLMALATFAIYYAYQYGKDMVKIGPLSQTTPILVVLLGILFLGERKKLWSKSIGVIIAVIGVILISK